MVNSSSEGKCIQSLGSTSTDYLTLNQSQLEELSTSGFEERRSVLRESIKKRLTARVIPMTRETTSHIENTEEEISGSLQKRPSSGAQLAQAVCNEDSNIRERRESVIKGENALISLSQINSKGDNVNIRKHKIYEDTHLEESQPLAKHIRISSPGTQNNILSMRRTPVPVPAEPRLLGDNVATLSLLTASQGHLATLQDEDGDTPLHIAIAQGQIPLVQYLIQIASTSGISLDIYNKMKQTPLHLSVITNQPILIRYLINAGVDINMPDRNGQTAIHLACQRSSVECLMELVNSRHGFSLEAKNFNGFTPLHEAVMSNSPDVIRFLVACGANVDSKDGKSGRTPLHYAVELELLPVIQLLISSGANVSAASFSGNTPIQTASGRGMHHVTKLLLGNPHDASGRESRHDSSKYKTKSTSWK